MAKGKQREELVSEIVGDAYYNKSIKINVLASALWAVCKDTKWHEYFEEETHT